MLFLQRQKLHGEIAKRLENQVNPAAIVHHLLQVLDGCEPSLELVLKALRFLQLVIAQGDANGEDTQEYRKKQVDLLEAVPDKKLKEKLKSEYGVNK